MRYSKLALLIFGAGLLAGLAVVVGEVRWPARLASGLMALGIVGLPVALIADLRRRRAAPAVSTRARSGKRAPRRTRGRRPAKPRR